MTTTRTAIDGWNAFYGTIAAASAGGLLHATDPITAITVMAICIMFSAALAICAGHRPLGGISVFVWSLAILSGGAALAFLVVETINP